MQLLLMFHIVPQRGRAAGGRGGAEALRATIAVGPRAARRDARASRTTTSPWGLGLPAGGLGRRV